MSPAPILDPHRLSRATLLAAALSCAAVITCIVTSPTAHAADPTTDPKTPESVVLHLRGVDVTLPHPDPGFVQVVDTAKTLRELSSKDTTLRSYCILPAEVESFELNGYLGLTRSLVVRTGFGPTLLMDEAEFRATQTFAIAQHGGVTFDRTGDTVNARLQAQHQSDSPTLERVPLGILASNDTVVSEVFLWRSALAGSRSSSISIQTTIRLKGRRIYVDVDAKYRDIADYRWAVSITEDWVGRILAANGVVPQANPTR